MILEFEVENFRSIKERQVFSMIAESSKSKSHNVFEHTLASGEKLRLLKAAVIYGANASGKSNFIKALIALKRLINEPQPIDKSVKFYEPFQFDLLNKNKPTRFQLIFIGYGNHKYKLEVVYHKSEIIKEVLDFYPKGQKRNLYKRISNDNTISHLAYLGQDLKKRIIKVFKNQLVLSKFGYEEPNDILSQVYLYFNRNHFSITNPEIEPIHFITRAIKRLEGNEKLLLRLSKLVRLSDTKIKSIIIEKSEDRISLFGSHDIFENTKKIAQEKLHFNQESKGSRTLMYVSEGILKHLQNGGVHIIDEIDTSLHPYLAKSLVMLFQSKKANPKNAQLIFTTHETTFLDKDFFRRDQIWITEKNEYGETELFSLQDFDEVREDTPFDKWYLAGRFGGLPDIKALEQIFEDEAETSETQS